MIKVSNELDELAELFNKNNKKLYIVGGFVRDSLIGAKSSIKDDIDLCSNVEPKQLKKILEKSKFQIKPMNENLGTMKIIGEQSYEFACFREEKYSDESHIPTSVKFIDDINEDAKRRDFKINAIYYDILNKELIDPLGGLSNIKERIIETTKNPEIVFYDDPERILRMIRFACCLGLDIPEEELKYAKQNSNKIIFIKKNRLRSEFEKLLNADNIYPEIIYTNQAHYRAMVLLGEIGAWKFILPSLDDMQKSNVCDFNGEKIYDHTLNCLKFAPSKIRLAILLHDTAKLYTYEKNKSFFGYKDFIDVLVEKNLGTDGLCYSQEIIKNVEKTIKGYDFNNFCLLPQSKVRIFIAENFELIEDIIEIKNVIKNENKLKPKKVLSAKILEKIYQRMKTDGTPLSRKNLKINGKDIINNFPNVKIEKIDDLLELILKKSIINPKLNTKDKLLKEVQKIIKKQKNLFTENQ